MDNEKVLYDDTAFELFAFAFIAVFIIPVTLIKIIKAIRAAVPGSRLSTSAKHSMANKKKFDDNSDHQSDPDHIQNANFSPTDIDNIRNKKCPCSLCVSKRDAMVVKNKRWYNSWGRPSNILFVLAWIALFWLTFRIMASRSETEAHFDPFEILQVSPSASDKDIQRAYRKMSLIYHPDKNPGNKGAEAQFVKIAKAYKSLTDEVAKENYKKYGNPDGYQGTKFGIGLPKVVAERRKFTLAIYLMVLVIVFPVLVALWWKSSSQKMSNSVLAKTYALYHEYFRLSGRFRDLVTAYSCSAEFEQYFAKENSQLCSSILNELKLVGSGSFDPKKTKFVGNPEPYMVQNVIILSAYLNRIEIPKKLQYVLNGMLESIQPLTVAMVDVVGALQAISTRATRQYGDVNAGSTSKLLSALTLSQCLYHGVTDKDSPLMQLPYFGPDEVKYCISKTNNVKTIQDFAELNDQKVKSVLRSFTEDQLMDGKEFALRYPNPELIVKDPIVEGEVDQSVHQNDTVSLKIILKLRRRRGSCDTPCLSRVPTEKKEIWWIIVADATKDIVLGVKRLSGEDLRKAKKKEALESDDDSEGENQSISVENNGEILVETFKTKLKFMAPVVGKYELAVHAVPDCYIGNNRVKHIKLNVLEQAVLENTTKYFDTDDENDGQANDEKDDEGGNDLHENNEDGSDENDRSDDDDMPELEEIS